MSSLKTVAVAALVSVVLTSAAAASAAAAAAAAADPAVTKPHIVFMMADDLGWHNVEWHNPDMKTPHTMQLVREGLQLDRHYAFVYCSPSRSSLLTGRLPFHVQQENYGNCDLGQGADANFTSIAQKLKDQGYATAHIGKWHIGMPSARQTPKGRGFDRSLVYFEGAEDHWTQRSCVDPLCIKPVNASTPLPAGSAFKNITQSPFDLWRDDAPAADVAGHQYNGYLFNDFALDVIGKHDTAKPLFMYLAPANSHVPLQAPQRFLDMYPEDWYLDRRQYAAMCSFWDELAGNVTGALKRRGMWQNTLFVFSPDNGGPAYWSTSPDFPHGAGANNWPLKGSKVTNWEGGVRVAAFVSGGALPAAMRNKTLDQHVHMADWYATFCHLAGCDTSDPMAAAAGLPPSDSVDMWPLISGASTAALRTEVPVSVDFTIGHGNTNVSAASALIQGDWKLLTGMQLLSYWQGPEFPNASRYGVFSDPSTLQVCSPACLYNIRADPAETNDVAKDPANAARLKAMLARLDELRATKHQPKTDLSQHDECERQIIKNNGFYGPWLDL